MTLGSFVRAAMMLALHDADRRLRREQPLRRSAAAQGGGRGADRTAGHALLRSDRQHGGGQFGRSRRARAGLRPGHQLHRRRLREEGHVAVHDRAGALQAQGGSREVGGHQRPGDADAGGSGVQAAGRSHHQAGFDAGQLRQGAGAARFVAGRPAIATGQREAGRDQSRLYRRDRAVRRRRDRAPGFRWRTRRRQRDADDARHHRAARSDLGQLQRQRARCAARARQISPAAAAPSPISSASRSKSGCRTRKAIRTSASSTTSRQL